MTKGHSIMKSNQDRICELRVHLKNLEDFLAWCVEAGDWTREEEVHLAISETSEEIRKLSV